MNLNDIDIKLAARSSPQAVNLGFVTARRYFWPLFFAGGLAMLPLLLIACLITYFYEGFFWASLFLWWAKPYVDRVILLNASRLLFREHLSLNDMLTSLGQALKNGLWLNLTFYRLSLRRCLTLPIMLLEKLSGRDYGQRCKIISRNSGSAANSMTIGLLHVDWVLYINFFFFIMMLLPESTLQRIVENFAYLNIANGYGGLGGIEWILWLLLPVQALCSLVVEVFYVMVGFMLYLNSRIRTEGWHIELAFKQIAQRLQGLMHTALSLLLPVIGVFCTSLLLTLSPPAQAAQNNAPVAHVRVTPEDDKSILKDLLLADDTNPYRVQGQWQPKKKHNPRKSDGFDLPDFPNLAPLIKIVLIVGGLALVFWLIVNRQRFAKLWQEAAQTDDDTRPSVMFGLDIRRESLPADIAGEAARLLAQGDTLAALSLLYRGSLAALVHDYQIEIKESDTEGDCLTRSQAHVKAATFAYFQRLTRAWQTTVYAHRHLPTADIDNLISQWRSAFAPPTPTETPNTQVSA